MRPLDAFDDAATLPQSVDVVVIGGGIVGISTALSLAERGVSVALCEKGIIAGEQSSRNWGWVRKMGRDPRELPLMIESMRIWDSLQGQHGLDLGFRRSGIVYLCRSERELARRTAWLDHARDFQLDSRMIDAADVRRVLPGDGGQWLGALHTPSDGRAEPQKAVPGLARRARQLGARIITGCSVRGIETTGRAGLRRRHRTRRDHLQQRRACRRCVVAPLLPQPGPDAAAAQGHRLRDACRWRDRGAARARRSARISRSASAPMAAIR